MKSILVIGSLNMDLVVQASRMPLAGETLAGNKFQMIPGGKGANQAVAASRSGADVQMIGCVGQDAFGGVLLQSLEQAGVKTAAINRLGDTSTGTATIIVEENGENRILIVPGANGLVTPELVNEKLKVINKPGYILLQHEIPLDTIHSVIRYAGLHGIPVGLNPAPFYPVPAEILARLDLLVVNETEASGFTGMTVSGRQSAGAAAEMVRAAGVKLVVVTLGADGALLAAPEGLLYQPAFKVNAVDTTAAGDTFIGSFTASLIRGSNLQDSLRFASAAAAIAVSRSGAQSSIPTENEVMQFLSLYN